MSQIFMNRGFFSGIIKESRPLFSLEWEDSLKKVMAMDWDRLIPGHSGAGGRLGTKQDVQNLLSFLQDASAEDRRARGQVLG